MLIGPNGSAPSVTGGAGLSGVTIGSLKLTPTLSVV